MATDWYLHAFLQHETLILRNRRDRLPDVRIGITYSPRRDPYFVAAFAMNFEKDFEDGRLIIHTAREGMSQETVRLYWEEYRAYKNKQGILDFIHEQKKAGKLAVTLEQFMMISGKWMDPEFGEIITSFLQDYMDKTIYARFGNNSIQRLQMFIDKDPLVAEHIWNANFSTRRSRQALVDHLDISLKNQKAFIEADTMDQLRAVIQRKTSFPVRSSSNPARV